MASHGFMNLSSSISKASSGYQYHALAASKKAESTRMEAGMLLRPPYHILAERRRRELVNKQFVVLSAIIPGLKKRDRTSLLGEAVRYLKQLQENVNMLEEQAKKKLVESAVLVNKPQSSANENFSNDFNHPLPEIEFKILDRNVLIRIHCEKHKGDLAKALREVEKLPLIVMATNVLPFGSCTMDLTVVGQVDNEVPITAKDLVRRLQSALLSVKSNTGTVK